MKTEKEIDAVIDQTYDGNKFHGMTYEEGVRCALEWVIGRSEEEPMEE